jgi:hypothetical protein
LSPPLEFYGPVRSQRKGLDERKVEKLTENTNKKIPILLVSVLTFGVILVAVRVVGWGYYLSYYYADVRYYQ